MSVKYNILLIIANSIHYSIGFNIVIAVEWQIPTVTNC